MRQLEGLGVDDAGWASAAAPCPDLWRALKTREPALGVVDRHELQQCLYWRAVGNLTLRNYPLLRESLNGSDVFLTGPGPLYAALARPEVVLDLLADWRAVGFIASHVPSLQPAVHFARAAYDHFSHIALMMKALAAERSGEMHSAMRHNASNVTYYSAVFGKGASTPVWARLPLLALWDKKVRGTVINALGGHSPGAHHWAGGRQLDLAAANGTLAHFVHSVDAAVARIVERDRARARAGGSPAAAPPAAGPARRLLQSQSTIAPWWDAEVVLRGAEGISNTVPNDKLSDVLQRWSALQTDFRPYSEQAAQAGGAQWFECPFVQDTAEFALQATAVTIRYYRGLSPPSGIAVQPRRNFSVFSNLPNAPGTCSRPSAQQQARKREAEDEAARQLTEQSWLNQQVFGAVASLSNGLLGVNRSSVYDFVAANVTADQESFAASVNCDEFTASRVIYELGACSFERVQFCSGPRRSLPAAMVIVAVATWAVTLIVPMGVSGNVLVWTAGYGSAVMFFTYGFSPMCGPIVPTCFFEDAADLLRLLLPSRIVVPQPLVNETVCHTVSGQLYPKKSYLEQTGFAAHQVNCFVPCSSAPFSFRDWQDSTAFVLCAVDAPSCVRLGIWLSTASDAFAGLSDSLVHYGDVFGYASAGQTDVLAAYNVCFVLTSVNAMPFLILIAFSVLMVVPVLRAIVDLLVSALTFWLSASSGLLFVVQKTTEGISAVGKVYTGIGKYSARAVGKATRVTLRDLGGEFEDAASYLGETAYDNSRVVRSVVDSAERAKDSALAAAESARQKAKDTARRVKENIVSLEDQVEAAREQARRAKRTLQAKSNKQR